MTETINGVSFEEYASACGNMTQGMPEAEVIKTLGLEKPVWDDTLTQWNARLGTLAREDMSVLSRYGEIFANPKLGRFATAKSPAVDINSLLQVVPDFKTYLQIQIHQSVAAKYGFDPVTILAEYGVDIGKWSTLNMHYGKEQNKLLSADAPDFQQRYQYFTGLHQYWQQHFENKYAQSKVDLGQDIQF